MLVKVIGSKPLSANCFLGWGHRTKGTFMQLIGFLSMPVLHLYRLQWKSQIDRDELVRLGEQMVQSSEGT